MQSIDPKCYDTKPIHDNKVKALKRQAFVTRAGSTSPRSTTSWAVHMTTNNKDWTTHSFRVLGFIPPSSSLRIAFFPSVLCGRSSGAIPACLRTSSRLPPWFMSNSQKFRSFRSPTDCDHRITKALISHQGPIQAELTKLNAQRLIAHETVSCCCSGGH